MPLPTLVTIRAAIVCGAGCRRVTTISRRIPKSVLFKRTAVPNRLTTTPDKFAIKMNSNHEQRVCFGSVFFSFSLPLVFTPRCVAGFGVSLLPSLYLCHQTAFGPTRSWQHYASVANTQGSLIVFNEGKTGYLLLMNLEYENASFAENSTKLLV